MRAADRQRPIDFAPAKVRAHGLRDAHARPLVGRRRGGGRALCTWRTSPQLAWHLPYIEIRTANSYPAVLLDCDDPEQLADAISRQLVPEPSWMVTSRISGRSHVVFALARPVHRYPEARPRPLMLFRRVADYYTSVTGADPGYVGVLTRNPMAAADLSTTTTWGQRDPFSLHQLAEVVPPDWQAPHSVRSGVGRNVDIFLTLMRWAGREENRSLPVLPLAEMLNEHYAHEGQGRLPISEVRAIAKSVERYRSQWEARGWHRPPWIARQAARGRLGGIMSGQARRERTRDRDEAIVAAVASGQSKRAVAKVYGLNEGTVRHIVAREGA